MRVVTALLDDKGWSLGIPGFSPGHSAGVDLLCQAGKPGPEPRALEKCYGCPFITPSSVPIPNVPVVSSGSQRGEQGGRGTRLALPSPWRELNVDILLSKQGIWSKFGSGVHLWSLWR